MPIKAPVFIIFTLIAVSCSKEDEPANTGITCDGSNLTYNTGINAIINSNCTASNCHGAGSPHGNFTSYAGMSGVISSGQFNSQVLVSKNMPQGSNLTASQLSKLKCWVDNGYPEN